MRDEGWCFADEYSLIVFPGKPDTTDLTWLFKWCVPKLSYAHVSRDTILNYNSATVFIRDEDYDDKEYGGEGKTPGEALRGAILALIGEGDEDKV